MDGGRFDDLARKLPAASLRRTALGLLFGGALGLAELTRSKAKKKGKKRKGKKGNKRKKSCPGGCDRCARTICLDGACQCSPGLIRHYGVCGRFPDCRESLFIVSDASECCSESVIVDDGGQLRCAPGNFMCLSPFDCADGGPCRGFMCTALYDANTGGGC